MKLRNKMAAITAAAMLAFAGAGYAAWTFTTERTAQEVSVIDKVAVGIELNDDYKLYNAADNAEIATLYLICDAPAGKAGILDGDGVYWAYDAAGANAVSSVYIKGSLAKDVEDNVKDNITTVTVSFEASHDFESDYITFGSFAAIADKDVTVANNAEVKSANFALPTLAYKDATLPQSIAELTAMNTALATELSGKKITCTAQITDAE